MGLDLGQRVYFLKFWLARETLLLTRFMAFSLFYRPQCTFNVVDV